MWLRIQGTSCRPLSVKNKGWNHLVPRRRQVNMWLREQGQGDEQCSSNAARCQTGLTVAAATPDMQAQVTQGQLNNR